MRWMLMFVTYSRTVSNFVKRFFQRWNVFKFVERQRPNSVCNSYSYCSFRD